MHGASSVALVRTRRSTSRQIPILAGALALLCASLIASGSAHAATAGRATTASRGAIHAKATPYPIGVFDLGEPSYFAPPAANAMPRYVRTYTDDFKQQLSPEQWFYFSGVPKGDPAGRFDRYHVVVTHGLLKIGTWRDPRFGNQWVSGGVGLAGVPTTYGAYFVRSRQTAPGPDTVELLWPQGNRWPPEIDFNESGESASTQAWFVHYENSKDQYYGSNSINVEHWHTWGVIWTPTSITFTVDGRAWGQVTSPSAIPTIPMSLDIQQQAWCGIADEPCPTQDSTLIVDWVAVYTPA
jgi:Glycosyl hydrolases family 16